METHASSYIVQCSSKNILHEVSLLYGTAESSEGDALWHAHVLTNRTNDVQTGGNGTLPVAGHSLAGRMPGMHEIYRRKQARIMFFESETYTEVMLLESSGHARGCREGGS